MSALHFIIRLLPALFFFLSQAMAQSGAVDGQWSATMPWPYKAAHAHLLPTGKVLFWSTFGLGDNARLWDPATNAITVPPKVGANVFCTGHAFLPDGRVLVAGGHVSGNSGLASAYTYNPFDSTWTWVPDMNKARWYPTATTLPGGDLLVLSGQINAAQGMNPLPQVLEKATGTWRDLTSAQLVLPYFPFMHPAPNGKLFMAGPNQLSRYLDTSGTGAWSAVASNNFGTRNWGASVMYDDGKLLITGGSTCAAYSTTCTVVPTDTAEVIDLNSPSPAWRYTAPMAGPRKLHSATLLPDGTVLVTGGSRGSEVPDNPSTSPALTSELWDPATASWTTKAGLSLYRGYHSIAMLLPDGRILSAGGNYDSSAELYSPPYLFKGPRPAITSAPARMVYGQSIFVGTPAAAGISKVTMIGISSVTHGLNMNQSIRRLAFSQTAGGLTVVAPSDPNTTPPGYYMLFILNANAVPSVAAVVRISDSSVGTPAAPSALTATSNFLNWTDNSGDETGFSIEMSENGQKYSEIATVNPNTTTWSTVALSGPSNRQYRLRAVNSSGPSVSSNTVTVAATLPTPPTALTNGNVSASQIDLSWTDNSSNEAGFRIERSTDGTTFVQAGTVGPEATTWSSTGLTASTPYHHRVRSYNSAGASASSNTTVATTTAAAGIPAPAGLSAAATAATQIALTWTDNSTNETGFSIERSPDGTTFSQVGTVGANTSTYLNTGLTSATPYHYRVRAQNATIASPWSNTATATTPSAVVPAAPTGLTVVPLATVTWLNLAWTDNSANETGFRIERSPDGATFTQIATVAANVKNYSNTYLPGSTTFHYRVAAFNNDGSSAYSNIANGTTIGPPAPPSGLTATVLSPTEIRLSWTDNAISETGFRVERSTDGTTFNEIAVVAANVKTYLSAGLTPSITYHYRVRSQSLAGNSAYSNTVSAPSPAGNPTAPSSLTGTAASSTQIDLAWTDNSGNETGFSVERSPDGSSFTQVGTPAANASSWSDTGLTASTTYHYRVRAANSGLFSAYSNAVSTSTQSGAPSAPVAPAALTASAVSATEVSLAWVDNSSNETAFQVERSTDGTTFTPSGTAAANATAFSDTGRTASTTYYYRVRAANGTVFSSYTNIATTTTQAAAPGVPVAPSALTATATSSTQIDLAWADNSNDETGFRVERSLDGVTFTETGSTGANVAVFSDTALTAATTYYYRVRAANGSTFSTYSNPATATTQPAAAAPPAPSGLAATATSSTQINLVWADNSSNETGFGVERSLDGNTFAQVGTTGPNVSTWSDTGLTASTTYHYRLRAFNGSAMSAYSGTANAATLVGGSGSAPTAPSGLTAFAVTTVTWINLAWNDNSTNETGFRIERSSDGVTFALLTTVGANVKTYHNTYLPGSTTYHYRVSANGANGTSGYSNTASATTIGPPAAPTALAAAATSPGQITLTWSDNSISETGFKVERSTDGVTFSEISAPGANVTTYSSGGLTSTTRYYYRVRAYNTRAGASAYSNTASAIAQ